MADKARSAVSSLQQKLPTVKSRRLFSDAQYFNATTKDETLVRQLNSNSVPAKLEAMKKIIAQLSKGKDVSEFFPSVVKNVACSSLEVKKLVYLFVIHYAEEKHDEALLAIAHFQKDMENKSQHVRALSLRVLSSIRVPIIVQIVLLAIRKCMSDASPWVRKAAALAVPKIYHLNPDEKPQLLQVIDTLLGDNSPTVHGAAAHAFACVCPDNNQLLHKHYRKLVQGLELVDEWGQVILLNLLLRYARTQFLSPFHDGYRKTTKFYGEEQLDSDDEELVEQEMDADHRLLLTHALPLLHSSNHAVVVAVAALFLHLAPVHEFSSKIGEALLRILHATRERQYIALLTIHSLATQRPAAFRPHIKHFYATPADPLFTQQMKIDTLALLADSTNVNTIIGEFKSYLQNSTEELLVRTVRALGRVANNNSAVSDACLDTLADLTMHPNEIVAGESVVVTRLLLQKVTSGHGKIIIRLTRLLESLELPLARASIIWLVGEYLHIPQVAQVAPDTFRKLVKGFVNETTAVKQQVLVLGSKVMVHNFEDDAITGRVKSVFEHLMMLVKYDESFFLRDRARIVRKLLIEEAVPELKGKEREIFAVAKKEADFSDPSEDRLRFNIGSLSHVLNSTVAGHVPLSDFPKEQPDPQARDTGGLWESSASDDDTDTESSTSASSSEEPESSEEESSEEPKPRKAAAKTKKQPVSKKKAASSSDSSSEESSSEADESSDESESSEPVKKPARKKEVAKQDPKQGKAAKDQKKDTGGNDLLQFLGDFTPAKQEGGAHAQGKKKTSPSPAVDKQKAEHDDPLASAWGFGMAEISTAVDEKPADLDADGKEGEDEDTTGWAVLSQEANENGLLAVYEAASEPNDFGMTVVRIKFTNTGKAALTDISFGEEHSSDDVTTTPFTTVASLAPGASSSVCMEVAWEGIDDEDDDGDAPSRPSVIFDLKCGELTFPAVIAHEG
ncbi:AP-3 complex subunit beta [Diplonema papillatum]|nr:AP-3 complex subunit beta [Diplonema papillatum]